LISGATPARLQLPANNQETYDQEKSTSQYPSYKTTPHPKTGFFVNHENIIHEGVQACSRSFVGKFITDKPIHINSIQTGLSNIWGNPAGLQIQEIDGKLLQFFMDKKIDQERILLSNPWIFRNSWLVIKPWDRETDLHSLEFDHVPIWIQL